MHPFAKAFTVSIWRHGPPIFDRPPRGRNDVVLYLDYDGVLHHENVYWNKKRGIYIEADGGFKLFEHAPLLEQLLEPHPDVKIVLSTSWARSRGFNRAKSHLSPALQARVIGSTWHSSMEPNVFMSIPRGQQIAIDVMRRQPAEWFALDDDDLYWPQWSRDKLIRTHDHLGISAPGFPEAISHMLACVDRKPSLRSAFSKP
jgi:HAD domain in Swiss Army Knife RNA repair proteins